MKKLAGALWRIARGTGFLSAFAVFIGLVALVSNVEGLFLFTTLCGIVAVVVVSILVARYCSYVFNAQEPPISDKNSPTSEAIEQLLVSLRMRSRRLRRFAPIVGALICATIASCLLVIFNADREANRLAGIVNYYELADRIAAERWVEEKETRDIDRRFYSDEGEKAQKEKLIESAQTRIRIYEQDLEYLRTGKTPDTKTDPFKIYSSASTKVSGAVILLFLVKMLTSLYRYTLRLAAFYDSRADALMASPTDDCKDHEAWAKIFYPSSIDFVTMKTPAEHGFELDKEAVKRIPQPKAEH